MSELLGHRTAEGDAHDVDPLVAELVEQPGDGPRQAGEPARPPVGRRTADARRVEADDLPTAGAELVLEGRGQVEARAEAGDQEQRPALSAYGGPQADLPHVDHADGSPGR